MGTKILAPESKIGGDIGGQNFFFPTPSSKYLSGTYPDFLHTGPEW